MSEWIKWNGGECPVPAGTIVDVEHRDGEICQNQVAWGLKNAYSKIDPQGSSRAGGAFWRNDGSIADIIAYRIIK